MVATTATKTLLVDQAQTPWWVAVETIRLLVALVGSFPSDEALSKLFYLALRNINQKWNMPIRDWKAALNWFSIEFEDRVPHQ